jgi:hypothetical protein
VFEEAIEKALSFTRAIHTISGFFESNEVQPGASSLFIVNDQGWALTCKHVAIHLSESERVKVSYGDFKAKRREVSGNPKLTKGQKREEERKLIQQFGLKKGTTTQILNTFIDCIDGHLNLKYICHKSLDLALLQFTGYSKLLCNNFPIFPKNSQLKPGKLLCRVGYPFPEFTNFQYNTEKDCIEWTEAGRKDTPPFPNEGMVTRLVADNIGNGQEIVGFETSTPGLRGQSGGPIFDKEGVIWGMQSETLSIHLGFDVDAKILKNGIHTQIKDSAFLHVGRAIHVEQIKQFMRCNNVSFCES